MTSIANLYNGISNSVETDSILIETVNIIQEIETRQIGPSKQDHVAHGSYTSVDGIKTYWSAVFDGHGTNQSIDIIRGADLDTIMKSSQPWIPLQELIQTDPQATPQDKLKSGSTMVYAKMTIEQLNILVEIVNIGDSTGMLIVNNQPMFITEAHDAKNAKEIFRLMDEKRVCQKRPIIHKASNFDLISPTALNSRRGTYIQFIHPTQYVDYELSPSQSLGHDGLTGLAPTVSTFRLKHNDQIKILLFSDGVGDILPTEGLASASTLSFMTTAKTTTEILDEAERRWKQEWTMHDLYRPSYTSKAHFPKNGYDDCCCGMIQVNLHQPPSFEELPFTKNGEMTIIEDTIIEDED
jgi:serine/threonine protein phosphatase PrpC